MQNSRKDVMSRLGGAGMQNKQRVPRVEYVNRAGERVNPLNGKPYSRPGAALSATANDRSVKKKNKKSNGNKPGGIINKLPVKTTGIMFSDLKRIPTNPLVDPPPRVCFNCWQPGHARSKCTRPAVSKMCNNCGRRGVIVTDCPRCKEGYIRYLAHSRGERLDENDLQKLFPRIHHDFESLEFLNEERLVDDGIEETIQRSIEQDDGDHEYYNEHEHEREARYAEPKVKYVETREYVKNPVSRYREDHEEDEETHRRREDYDYEDGEGFYDERRDRETRYRESSEDRSIERSRRSGNNSSDLDSDPVKEVLQLAQSIAHLSPETQEMIMKQVMAERQEKARLRAIQEIAEEQWP